MTAKKNEPDEIRNEYAPEEAFSFKGWFIQNFFVMAGILMAVINLFMASRLAPLNQDITLIRNQVAAMEVKTNDTVSREEFVLINGRLDRIQQSLNTLLDLHLKQ
jgi:hypothetical protein